MGIIVGLIVTATVIYFVQKQLSTSPDAVKAREKS
jgi:hypothetical protein